MSRSLPYAVFPFCYAVLGLALCIPAAFVQNHLVQQALEIGAPVVAAPVAIVLAQRTGHLAASGLLVASLLLVASFYVLLWKIYDWQAAQAGSSIPLWRVAQVGGWSFALGLMVQILAPVVWRGLVPRPAGSFKPTPLRGRPSSGVGAL
jgi:hypothetical protein